MEEQSIRHAGAAIPERERLSYQGFAPSIARIGEGEPVTIPSLTGQKRAQALQHAFVAER
jgi:hypothetical protein